MLCKQSYCTVAVPAIASYEGSALPSHAETEQCFIPALGYHLNNNVKFCILFHTYLFPYILCQLLINSFQFAVKLWGISTALCCGTSSLVSWCWSRIIKHSAATTIYHICFYFSYVCSAVFLRMIGRFLLLWQLSKSKKTAKATQ